MKKLLITILAVILTANLFAQIEENLMTQQQKDSIFSASLADSSSWETFEAVPNEYPNQDNHPKMPIHHGIKVIGGMIFVAVGTTDFSNKNEPFKFGQNLLPNVCLITNRTYHNLVYGFANNSVKIVNGFPFGENGLDIYVVPGIYLNSGVISISSGIEKKFKISEEVNFFIFTEVGKDIKPDSKFSLSFGFHVNIQSEF